MPTEYLTAVGSEGVALFHRGEPAAEHLCTFLQGKGYRVYATTDGPQLIKLVQANAIQIALVQIATAADALTIMGGLRGVEGAPPIIALCERAVQGEIAATLVGDSAPEAILVRPVPFDRILGEIEKQLTQRVGARATGEQPAISFVQLLSHLWGKGQSGRLQVTVNGVQTTIYLRDGLPVFAEQGSLEDTLGRLLVRTGRISNEDFSRAVALITDRMVDNEQMRLGEALIELGILTAQEIHEALREQVRQKILSCFRAQRFHSDFRAGEELLEPVGDFSSPMELLLTEGLKTVNPARLEQLLSPHDARYPLLARDPASTTTAFGLTRQEQTFLTILDGTRALGQVRHASQLDPIHANQVLSALLFGRCLALQQEARPKASTTEPMSRPEAAPAPAPEPAQARRHGSARRPDAAGGERTEDSAVIALYLRIKGRPDHGVLGVKPGASAQQIEEAYRQRTAELQAVQPDKTQGSPSVRGAFDALATHVKAARERLLSAQTHSDSQSELAACAEPDERRRRLRAEESYQGALEHYRAGQTKQALAKANEAVNEHPEAADYQLLQAWLAYRSSSGQAKQKTATRAFDCARRAFGADGTNVLANLVLGHLLGQKGKLERAKRHLLLAMHHDAHKMGEIQDELKKLDQHRAGRRPKER